MVGACDVEGLATTHGLVWDDTDAWVIGFQRRIGSSSCLEAELWALCHGIHLARNLGISRLQVEVDSKVSSEIGNGNNSDSHEEDGEQTRLSLDTLGTN